MKALFWANLPVNKIPGTIWEKLDDTKININKDSNNKHPNLIMKEDKSSENKENNMNYEDQNDANRNRPDVDGFPCLLCRFDFWYHCLVRKRYEGDRRIFGHRRIASRTTANRPHLRDGFPS